VNQYHLFGAKGGVGTTTVAASLALMLSRTGSTVIRAVDEDPCLAMLGVGVREYPYGGDITYNLSWMTGEGFAAVNDNGINLDAAADAAGIRLLVTRGCYLALRRAIHSEGRKHIDGIVLIEEPGRALGRREVADVLGKPIVATIPYRDTVCRAIDAGVLVSRLPEPLERAAKDIIKTCQPMSIG
jgi:MinD superfamily P-loop ATPase